MEPHAKPTDEKYEDAPSTESLESNDDVAFAKRIRRKCDINLLPIIFFLLLIGFLDRVNIGNARIQGLEKDLNMHGTDYNIALFVFFITYILFEVPSNMILKNVRPSIWLSGIMFAWGVLTVMEGITRSFAGLVVCRLLIGAFEAGFLPGSIYLISMYYKRYDTQTRVTAVFSGSIIAGAVGGLLAYAIANMQGVAGYSAWRWIFIIEGLATCVIAAASYFVIPDWPETARFLTEEERVFLIRYLTTEVGTTARTKVTKKALIRTLKDVKLYLSTLMFIGVATTGYSISFFVPTILSELGWTAVRAQVMSIPIYVCATFFTLIISYLSDHFKHRYAFILIGCVISITGYGILLNTVSVSVKVRYMALYFVATGAWIAQPIVMAWLNNNMGGHYKRGVGTAAVIGTGNIAGIIGSNIYLTSESPFYKTEYSTGLSLIILVGVAATVNFSYVVWENRQRRMGNRDYLLSLPAEEVANLGDDHPSFVLIY